ncbi:probable glycosyltransferase STELLO1, partial [Paramuricea clavata]
MRGPMSKYSAKWAIGVAFIITVIYAWISYYDFDKLYETIWFKRTGKNVIVPSELRKDVMWSKIERKPKPENNEIYAKWIVVTSVAPPTDQVKKLSKIKGWKLIVVADTKTPANW